MCKDLDKDAMAPLKDHLTDSELRHLLKDQLSRRKLAERLIHLATCDDCRDRLRAMFPEEAPVRFRRWFGTPTPPATQGLSKPHLEAVVRWGREKLLAAIREMEAAEKLWLEISPLSESRRHLLVLNSTRFHNLGFVVTLLEAARNTWLDDPEEAHALVQLAIKLLSRMEIQREELRRANDLEARAYTYLGNCERILGNFKDAYHNFQEAHGHLREGTGDPMELALALEYEGTFFRDRRLLTAARVYIRTASLLYQEVGDMESAARMIIIEALALREAERPTQALAILQQLAERHTVEELGLENYYGLHHNQVLLLVDLGRFSEARTKLKLVRHLAERRGNNRFDLIRLEWLEALLHDKSGEDEDAEAKYRNVQQFFLDEGIGYDAAFVSLDLAAFYLDRGRCEEARDLAAELTPVFLADDIHREAVASLLLFREALEREEATTALARATAKALREVQGRPPHRQSAIH